MGQRDNPTTVLQPLPVPILLFLGETGQQGISWCPAPGLHGRGPADTQAPHSSPHSPSSPCPLSRTISPALLQVFSSTPAPGSCSDALTHPSPKICFPPFGPPQPPVPAPAGLFPCSSSGVAPNSPPNLPAKKREGPKRWLDPDGQWGLSRHQDTRGGDVADPRGVCVPPSPAAPAKRGCWVMGRGNFPWRLSRNPPLL